jgi:hypothetical protein
MFFIRTDGQTDTRSTQNYSSEPNKNLQKKNYKIKCFLSDRQKHVQLKTIVRNLTKTLKIKTAPIQEL